MLKKIFYPSFLLLTVIGSFPESWAQSPALSDQAVVAGPVSLEPAIEKDGVRVALQTSLQKKDELKVLVKISNFSDHPILVSPDAIEASTGEGFVIQPISEKKESSKQNNTTSTKNNAWSTISKVAALVPFSDPYRIVSTTAAIASYAKKNASAFSEKTPAARRGILHEVILQPGMATHGLIIYDASSLRAFDYAPALHIKVTVGEEPFEFKFASAVKV